MLVHFDDAPFVVYFGDRHDSMIVSDRAGLSHGTFAKIQHELRLDGIVFLKQIHGAHSMCITRKTKIIEPLHVFQQKGDVLISSRRAIGIGVLTADCLPVIIYDFVHHCIGIAHAGWRGTFLSIAVAMVEMMQKNFDSQPRDMVVYFGPCAKICCYQITHDFLSYPSKIEFMDQVVVKREKLFFDLPLLNRLQLVKVGVCDENINDCYNQCTICNNSFHSFRRDGVFAGRQETVVALLEK
jgi:YfiH family protein